MEIETAENVTERRGFIKRPGNTTVVIRAGYSVICDIKDRLGVVLKVPLPFEEFKQAMEIEKRVYRRLGKHPNLPNVVDMNEYGIYLKRAESRCLRLYYNKGGKATPEERIKWCQDVAEVLNYVHENNIRYANLSRKNLLIDSARNILLCDFEVVAEIGFWHPDEREYPAYHPKPFHEKIEEQECEVEKLIKEGKYPNVSELPLGDVIVKCWKREGYFNLAADVAEEITYSSILPLARNSSGCSSNKDLSNHSSSKDSPSIFSESMAN
ncbi:hypothetical protein BU26DRAFT_525477 [Trematosphaeria pertusa]|uniref:Protein kinase domain-containing protein n=1 Tax=Trematosphaeria pertusa TaxID=390896 RepID=A0A6A6HSB9_9PLEO|nr:uncharacterized protein BU26DRAFT_525477 [Trematosphaeria pertusa]KAF2240911.1 hypothetical protein BU26DRAFT_525477 [Trematosphaeria pertusa]